MTQSIKPNQRFVTPLIVFGALMSLGWAINGMIGNAPGSAISGAFAALAAVVIIRPHSHESQSLLLVRVAAFGAMGYWFGGEMTYGQTFSLMQPSTADGAYYWWALLGVAVKGGAWSGVGAAFIGLGLMARRYRWYEIALLVLAMTGASIAGQWFFNTPNTISGDVALITFSFDPAKLDIPGRTECWGALWSGLIVLLVYARCFKKDSVTFRFGLYGALGGALGFALGQVFQAYSWWHPTIALRPWIDWWKVMELTHGFVVGLFLAYAALTTRRSELSEGESQSKPISPMVEWIVIIIWMTLLVEYFARNEFSDLLAAFPFVVGIPLFAALISSRWLPWIIIGVQVPLATGLISANECMSTFPYDNGYKTPEGVMISLISVLSYAWPMILLGVVMCSIPIYIWLYRKPDSAKSAMFIFHCFIGYHVISVLIQFVWATLHFAPSWGMNDLFLFSRPYITLSMIFILFWIVIVVGFSRKRLFSD